MIHPMPFSLSATRFPQVGRNAGPAAEVGRFASQVHLQARLSRLDWVSVKP